jgi:hypothetical protein
MTKAEEYFHELTRQIEDVKPGKMFGTMCMKIPNGKSGAMFWKECIVVKLHGELLTEALSLDGAQPFEPMKGRYMKEWVQIPFEYNGLWKKFALSSTESVKNIISESARKKSKL